jgi:hypothetical protein
VSFFNAALVGGTLSLPGSWGQRLCISKGCFCPWNLNEAHSPVMVMGAGDVSHRLTRPAQCGLCDLGSGVNLSKSLLLFVPKYASRKAGQ